MDDHSAAFGLLLRRFRGRANLTQEALAARSGVSLQTITKLERGVHRAPHGSTVQALATALHLTSQERVLFERAAVAMHRTRGADAPEDTVARRDMAVVTALRQVLAALEEGRPAVVEIIVPSSRQPHDGPQPATIRLTIP